MKRILFIILFIVLPVAVSAAEGLVSTNKSESKAFVTKIRKLQTEGYKMDLLRSSRSESDRLACLEKMRRLQPQVDRLEKAGEALPKTSANMSFRSAAASLKFCVSCNESKAVEQCAMVDNLVKEGFNYLRAE